MNWDMPDGSKEDHPVFPSDWNDDCACDDCALKKVHKDEGMSLREFFTGCAIIGLSSNPSITAEHSGMIPQLAKQIANGAL